MNRRGFLGLLGKLAAVGTAMSVAPPLLKPIQKAIPAMYFDTTNNTLYWWDSETNSYAKVEIEFAYALAS